MNWDAIAAVSDLASAIAVIATLVYLAVQVRDAGRSASLAAAQTNRYARIENFIAQRDSPYFAPIRVKLREGKELDADERVRWTSHCSAMWGLIYSDWVQRQLGLGEEFLVVEDSMVVFFDDASMITYWRDIASNVYPQSFVKYIDSKIHSWEGRT